MGGGVWGAPNGTPADLKTESLGRPSLEPGSPGPGNSRDIFRPRIGEADPHFCRCREQKSRPAWGWGHTR